MHAGHDHGSLNRIPLYSWIKVPGTIPLADLGIPFLTHMKGIAPSTFTFMWLSQLSKGLMTIPIQK